MMEQQHFDSNGPIPRHVAIIMDGNGRWAEERGLKRTDGHREGLNAVRRVARAAATIGVDVLTVYAFSTENWKRPVSEVRYLMQLPELLETEILPELIENNVQVRMMGFTEKVPKATLKIIQRACDKTAHNDGLILNIAFNYGSRAEIVQATRHIATDVQNQTLKIQDIDEQVISDYLLSSSLGELADPDFLIRSSGEVRLSNYLLWQLAYAEMYFTDTKWPDFDQEVFLRCVAEYQHRQRRYGGLIG